MRMDFANICGICALVFSVVLILLGVEMTQWAIPVWILAAISAHNYKE